MIKLLTDFQNRNVAGIRAGAFTEGEFFVQLGGFAH